MKRYVSVWVMPKREGFTLIEVMVAVMIISVVIAALLQMQGDTTNKFFQLKSIIHSNQYNSFLLSNAQKYGFEKSHINLKTLVDDFELESDLRRKLKSVKISLEYEKLQSIDTSNFEETESEENSLDGEEEESNSNSGIIFEIGKSILKTEKFRGELIRVRLQ